MAFSILDRPLPIYNVSHENIQEYILKVNSQNDGHGSSAALKESVLGSKLFKAGFVTKFTFQEVTNGATIVSAVVKAEYKKEIYSVNMTIANDNEVIHVNCECPGGAPPACCKHTFAVLTFINDYCAKELHCAPTEKLQVWHQPAKKRRLSPKKTDDVFKRKTDSDNLANETSTDVNFKALQNLPLDSPVFNVLHCDDFDINNHLINITLQLPSVQPDEIKENAFSSIELDVFQTIFIFEKIKKNLDECHCIEKETIGQNNNLWSKERAIRITASNFHKVLTRKSDFDSLSKILANPADISHLPAVKFGKENEHNVKYVIKKKFKNAIFRDVGLVINPNFPYLGSSPDGLLFSKEEQALIEIKSVFNRKLSLSELVKQNNFCLMEKNGKYNLKRTHSYYTQIQGQLAICNLKKTYFCLSYGDSSLHIEEVYFDDEFWGRALQQLKHFYFNYYINYVSSL